MLRNLQIEHNKKPIDIGNGNLAISVTPDGNVNSVNTKHSKHGFITLTSLNQFPVDQWYNSNFVRDYRRNIAKSTCFTLESELETLPEKLVMESLDNPRFYKKNNQISFISDYSINKDQEGSFLVQKIKLKNKTSQTIQTPFKFEGNFSLNRSSYAALTERNPINPPSLLNRFKADKHTISITNPELQASANIFVRLDGEPVLLKSEFQESNHPVYYKVNFEVLLKAEQERVITITLRLKDNLETGAEPILDPISFEQKELKIKNNHWKDRVIEKNISYILDCCAIPLDNGTTCMITDHQLLPLSWNRDAYYMIECLFEAQKTNGKLYDSRDTKIKKVIKRHLKWLFEVADRPDGYWGRAYVTNGYCKDKVFQLDQQCYPIIELLDYTNYYEDHSLIQSYKEQIIDIVNMIEQKRTNHSLFPTDETPADDEVEYPYHFSSQILMWHFYKCLNEYNQETSMFEINFDERAKQIQRKTIKSFQVERSGKPMFAYLTDLNGEYRLYHDANDLPTVLAPLWGFCNSDSECWKNTMEFAFSTDNNGGFYDGLYGGLGSIHTPHKWPLGDAQQLLYAYLSSDSKLIKKVEEKLYQTAFWDGLFPEAVNENTGIEESRHWFSWPGAFISSLFLKEKRGSLNEV